MREFTVAGDALRTLLENVLPHLDERQRRILAGRRRGRSAGAESLRSLKRRR